MSTRITESMISSSVLSDINRAGAALGETQQRLASGKKITQPSDDPFGTSQAMSLRDELEGNSQYQRNVSDAVAWTNVTDTALSKISDVVQRVHELTVQGGSDTSGQPARNAIAQEIDQLIESVKQEANASYAGHYVLGGTATTTRPYSPGTAAPPSAPDPNADDGGAIVREIGPGVRLTVNVNASTFLGDGSDGKLLNVLRDISAHLKSGTPADADALRTTDLTNLTTQDDALSAVQAQVGAIANRLTTAQGRLQEVAETTTKLLSDTEDADMAKTMVDYSTQQSVYRSALQSGANIVQASLLDFLK